MNIFCTRQTILTLVTGTDVITLIVLNNQLYNHTSWTVQAQQRTILYQRCFWGGLGRGLPPLQAGQKHVTPWAILGKVCYPLDKIGINLHIWPKNLHK